QQLPSNPHVDVSVTTSGQGAVPFGSWVTFTVVVSNNGPDAATGTSFNDWLPANLYNVTWTSSTSTGVTGSAGSGDDGRVEVPLPAGSFMPYITLGGIREVLDLPANSSITYVIHGTFGAGSGNILSNWANAAVSPSLTDTDLANNTANATDTTLGNPTT